MCGALQGKLDPVVGRKAEIERVTQILGRRTKNNPCLIGEPGVGKTAVAEGLAQLIARGDVPETIENKQVHNLQQRTGVSCSGNSAAAPTLVGCLGTQRSCESTVLVASLPCFCHMSCEVSRQRCIFLCPHHRSDVCLTFKWHAAVQVITLDMGLLVAGTKYRGEFEERLKKLMEEIKQNDNIILVRTYTCPPPEKFNIS